MTQSIFFDQIPNGLRKPGVYVEFNNKLAVRGLPANAQKVCIIGQKTVSGSLAVLTPTKIFSEADAVLYAGNGSMMHRMVKAAYAAYPYLDLTIVNLADHGSGVSATGTNNFTGPATGAGLLVQQIGKDKIEVAIASGETATEIATALVAAITARPDLPVTAANSAGVVTFTAKNKGTLGNQIKLLSTVSAAGVTSTIVAMASGATDPDLSTALTAIYAAKFDIIVSPYNNLSNLTTLASYSGSSAALLKAHIDSVSGPLEQRRCRAVIAHTATVALSTTLAASLNSERIMLVLDRGIMTHSVELAAAAAAVWASMSDPAQPLNYKAIPGIDAPVIANRLSRAEQETLLANGVTPLAVSTSEATYFVRAVTTYTVNASSTPDISYLDVTTITSLDYGDLAIRTRIQTRFPAPKKTLRTRKAIRSEILAVMKDLEAAEIWRDIDAYSDQLVIEDDATDPARWNVLIPAPVVPGAHILAMQLVLYLSPAA